MMKKKWISKGFSIILSAMLVLAIIPMASVSAEYTGIYTYGYENAYSVYAAKVERSTARAHTGDYSLALNTDAGWNVIQAPLYDGEACGGWHTVVVDFWMYLDSTFDLSKLTAPMRVYTYTSSYCGSPTSQTGANFSVSQDGVGHWNHISVTFANNTSNKQPYLYIPYVDAGSGFGGKAYIDDVTVTSVSMGTYASGYAQTLIDGYFDDANNDLIVPTVEGGTIPTPVRDGYTFDGWYTESTYENLVTTYAAGNNSYYAKWTEILPYTGIYTYGYEDVYEAYASNVARSTARAHSGEYSLALDTDQGWKMIQAPLTSEFSCGEYHTLVVDFWMYVDASFNLSRLTESMRVYTYNGSTVSGGWCGNPAAEKGSNINVTQDWLGHWNHVSVTFTNNTTGKQVPYLYVMQCAGFGGKVYIDDVTVTSVSLGTYASGYAQTLKDGYFDDANNDLIVPTVTGGMIPAAGTRSRYIFEGWYTDSNHQNKVTTFLEGNNTYYANWIFEGCEVSKTYLNTFDNEAGTVDTATHSVADVYSYYDYGLSIFDGEKVTRKTQDFGKAWNYCSGTAEPYIDLDALTDGDDSTVPGTYGKDSYGSMMLAYPEPYGQQEGFYARFRVWDNQSTKTLFGQTGKPLQVIEASNATTIYRISFDYKAQVPAGYTGGIYYFNGLNSADFRSDTQYRDLTELSRIKDTNGAWVHSGYAFAQTNSWTVASLALIMDDNAKSLNTKVWIDNLKIEVTDISPEDLVTVTFMDDGDVAFTVTGVPGMPYTPFVPEKEGYFLSNWLDYDDEPVSSFVIPNEDDVYYYAEWAKNPHAVTKTYMNYFDNEAGTVDTATHSIDDVYSYYDYALSYFDGEKVTRKTKYFGKAYNGCVGTAEPYIDLDALTDGDDSTVPATLGNNSYGSMMLGYPVYDQQTGYYARFRVWDNQSTREIFNPTNKPRQLIEASDANTIYRVSFDYKAELPEEDYTGGLYYFNGSNTDYFKTDTSYSDLTELTRIKDTAGTWVRSEYTYVRSAAWCVASIALIMDDNAKSLGTKVWIDNLKIEVMDTSDFDDLVTFTFMDGGTQIKTVSGLYGLDSYVANPEKWGFTFAGWTDENGNAATVPAVFSADATYYATWNFRLMNVKGDLTSDNEINILDLIRLKKYSADSSVSINEANAFLSDYRGSAYRLTAMTKFLLGQKWEIEDIPLTYAQSDATYRYVWGDEFNGTKLDSNKWRTEDQSTNTADKITAHDSDVMQVTNGELTLRSILYTDPSDENVKYKMPEHLVTKRTMNFKYGYIEMRARIPLAVGATPSFWMKGCNNLNYQNTLVTGSASYLAETDIFERTETGIAPNLHRWTPGSNVNTNYNANHATMGYAMNENDTSYHIYGFKWTPTQMIMSVDGVAYATFNITSNWDTSDSNDMSGFQDPAYLIIGNRVSSSIADEDLPTTYSIDWIRLFQADNGDLYTRD